MPEVESADEVQFYSSKEHLLSHKQSWKALKFVELDKIKYDQNARCFVCLPIDGYNSTSYAMVPNKENEFGFECDCQGFQTKKKKAGVGHAHCSHVLALHYYFDKRNKAKGWGRWKQVKLS